MGKKLTIEDVIKGLDDTIEINDLKINAYKQGLEILENSVGQHFTKDMAELTKEFIKDLEFNQVVLKGMRSLIVIEQ